MEVRIGVHTGDAIHEGDHFFGTAVHYAARVASEALGGEVLVSNVVHDLVAGPGGNFRESREAELASAVCIGSSRSISSRGASRPQTGKRFGRRLRLCRSGDIPAPWPMRPWRHSGNGCSLALGSRCPVTRGRESSWQSVSESSFQV